MGWPRKGDHRLYFERKSKSYMLLCVGDGRNPGGAWGAVANCLSGTEPSLCYCGVSDGYIYSHCRRVAWSDLPKEWKRAFVCYMSVDTPWSPDNEPGLHRTSKASAIHV